MCRQHCAYTTALTSDFFLEKSLSALKKTNQRKCFHESNSVSAVRDTHNMVWIGNRTVAGTPWLFKFSYNTYHVCGCFRGKCPNPDQYIIIYRSIGTSVSCTHGRTCSESFFERSSQRSQIRSNPDRRFYSFPKTTANCWNLRWCAIILLYRKSYTMIGIYALL